MDRAQAEAIVRRDLSTVIAAAWALMPVQPPAETYEEMYRQMFDSCVEGILDGTIRLTDDGRLTITPLGSARFGPQPQSN
jgi:hypothetical protein